MRATEIQNRPHLYLDMDGTIADFFTAWARLHGKRSYKEIGDQAQREASIVQLNARGPEFVYEFFRTLPPLHGGLELISWLKRNRIPFTVLSAPLRGNEQASIDGKREWLDKYNPGTSGSAIFTGEKFHYATRGGHANVLVDDFKKYIGAWRQAGGTGILYRDNNVDSVIQELSRIYDVDSKLDESQLQEYSYMDADIQDVLEQKGYKLLGSGVDQAAYLAPGGEAVLKIFGSKRSGAETRTLSKDQKMFLQWAQYCANHAGNPFLPRFLKGEGGQPWAPFLFRGRHYLQIWQERLYPLTYTQGVVLVDLVDIFGLGSLQEIMQVLRTGKETEWIKRSDLGVVKQLIKKLGQRPVYQLLKTINDLDQIAKKQGWVLDLHEGNFMRRQNGHPVIVDPWVV